MSDTFSYKGSAGALPGLPGLPILAWREGDHLHAMLPVEHLPGQVDRRYHHIAIADAALPGSCDREGVLTGDAATALAQVYPKLQLQLRALPGIPRPEDHTGYARGFWSWASRQIKSQITSGRAAELVGVMDPMPGRGENWAEWD